MKRANTMSTITVELTIKVKTKFIPSNAEKTKRPMDSSHHRCQIFTNSIPLLDENLFNFVSSYKLFVCCNFQLQASRLALRPSLCTSWPKILARQHSCQLLQVQPCWDFNNSIVWFRVPMSLGLSFVPIRFASETSPRPGLAEPRSASIACFGKHGTSFNRTERERLS